MVLFDWHQKPLILTFGHVQLDWSNWTKNWATKKIIKK